MTLIRLRPTCSAISACCVVPLKSRSAVSSAASRSSDARSRLTLLFTTSASWDSATCLRRHLREQHPLVSNSANAEVLCWAVSMDRAQTVLMLAWCWRPKLVTEVTIQHNKSNAGAPVVVVALQAALLHLLEHACHFLGAALHKGSHAGQHRRLGRLQRLLQVAALGVQHAAVVGAVLQRGRLQRGRSAS